MQVKWSEIKGGPAHLEQLLVSGSDAGRIQGPDKLTLYKELIQKVTTKKAGHFCLAHLCCLAAQYSSNKEERKSYLEAALEHYRQILRGKIRRSEEYFYSCYMSGNIMQSLSFQWAEVEEVFLLAHETNPCRGEPIVSIVRYYQSVGEWPIAYIFSTYARDHFLDSRPLKDKWGVDNDLYNWTVLDYHTASCFALGRRQEATETFGLLYRRAVERPELFRPEEIKRISSQIKLFPEIEALCQI